MNLLDEAKLQYKRGSMLIKLIMLNLGIFLLVHIVNLFLFLFNIQPAITPVVYWLSLPAFTGDFVVRPWSLFTYMFLHQDFFHILFNMLWLYWFGQIFLRYFEQKKLLGVYLLGGLAGGLFYFIAYNIFPVFDQYKTMAIALGASASVMAIVIGISVYKPNYEIPLLFIGPVKIKYIALATVVIDLMSIPVSNAGGHLAHLGGAALGWFFANQATKGHDITRSTNRLIDKLVNLFSGKRNMRVKHKKSTYSWRDSKATDDFEFNKRKANEQEQLDEILDKISRKGYESLTKEEKAFLFKQGK